MTTQATQAVKQGDLELITIYEIGKILNSSLDLPKILRGVLNLLSGQLGIGRGMISLMQESGELHLVSAIGLSEDEFKRGCYGRSDGVTGLILKNGVPCVVPDMAKEPLFLDHTGSLDVGAAPNTLFIGVPIKAGHECLGVLSITRSADKKRRSYDDCHFLAMVANLIGQTARLHREVTAGHNELLREKSRLQKELRGKYTLDNVIGVSKAMQEVFSEVHQAAPSRASVLLRGESGTGKEAIGRAIHFMSPRKNGPFIRVNCAALSESLLESELFGHEKGAFTGAHSERKGRFEQADGGTLFLDEIGDISPAFQAKLLRVLQERELERVGGNRTIKVDVRLITATNRDLERAVAKGDFRADLYYRINVVSIFLPPLRERREDIPPLIEYFLAKYNRENNRELTLTPEAFTIMLNCYWPGNVRELENCVERAATMARGKVIRDLNFPCTQHKCLTQALHGPRALTPEFIPIEAVGRMPAPAKPPTPPADPPAVPSSERERLVQAMEQCGWVQAKAARLLNLTPRQMGYALQKHSIEIKRF